MEHWLFFLLSSHPIIDQFFCFAYCIMLYYSFQVIEVGGSCCVTLGLTCPLAELHPSTQMNLQTVNHENTVPRSRKLKLQWFSKDYLVKFVSLLKAIHEKETGSPLVVRCIS